MHSQAGLIPLRGWEVRRALFRTRKRLREDLELLDEDFLLLAGAADGLAGGFGIDEILDEDRIDAESVLETWWRRHTGGGLREGVAAG